MQSDRRAGFAAFPKHGGCCGCRRGSPPGRAGSGRGAGYRSLAFRPAGVQSGWSPDWPGRRDCCSGGRQDRARQGWPGPRCQGRRRADARLLRGAGTVRRGLLVRPCRDGPSAARTWSTSVNRPPGAPSGVPPVDGSRVTARASQARAGRSSLANASARRPLFAQAEEAFRATAFLRRRPLREGSMRQAVGPSGLRAAAPLPLWHRKGQWRQRRFQ